MKPPHIHHIGIIVEDLGPSIALFERMFDLKPSKTMDIPDAGLKIAQLKAENIDIELIEYSGEGAQGKRVMGTDIGFNHLSVGVENIEAAVREAEKKGFRIQEGFPREGSSGKVAFFEPESTNGILLEICEH